ncbi:hypothetical protein GCM10010182_00950 [Actinomadura cremea]|nr:hypothetical protein GCM10010182_00950 [Actinomadura cremea]
MAQTGGEGTRTDSFGYDDAGNMTTRTVGSTTQTLEWDPEGNLAKITEGANDTSFIYTADGDRLLRKDPTGTTLYLPGMELRLHNGAATAQGTRYYTLGDQTIAMRTGSDVQFLAPDHQGTSQLAIDAATQTTIQRRYTPFGTLRGVDEHTTWPDEKGFVGGTNDPGTGLVHLGAREYDPATGRFITVDPLINLDDEQSLNGYAYAGNSPITFNDATGLCRDVNPIMGPISCHAPGNDGDPRGIGGEPNPGGHVYRGTPAQYNPSRYHYTYNPNLKPRKAPQVNTCGWKCKLKRAVKSNPVARNISANVGRAWDATKAAGNFIDRHWGTISKIGSAIGFGVCLVVSAGACVVVGASLALASYGMNVKRAGGDFTDEAALKQLGFDLALSAGGGYLGKAIPSGKWGASGGWQSSAISRSWGRAHWRHAERTPVNMGRTSYSMSINAGTGSPGLLIGVGVRSYPSLVIGD